jgi:poly [ADP-ribose] polymerase
MEYLRHEMYVKSNVASNNNKFWEFKILPDFSVEVRNGRVGGKGQNQNPKHFDSEEEANDFAEKKIREKLKKEYVKFKGILGSSAKVESPSGSLTNIALDQIGSTSSETASLIKRLAKQNIHNIVSNTTIQYDIDDGVFKTPLGIVTQEGIDEARELLNILSPFVTASDFDNNDFIDSMQNYIQLVPRKVGRKLESHAVIPNTEALQKESNLLDSLDASLQEVLTSTETETKGKGKKKSAPKLFNVELNILDNKKILAHITKFFNATRNSMHRSYNLKIKNVHTVSIKHMFDRYEKKGKKIGGVMELWHGTQTANVLSILKGGLIIPKSSSGHVTGRMFGDGVYFSDQSTKSLNYSQGYWSGGSDNNPFMFLSDVAMGRYYVPSSWGSNFPKSGYDSTFAKANQSGVRNNEMIVYDLAQCNLTYLVEFEHR